MPERQLYEKREYVRADISANAKITLVDSNVLENIKATESARASLTPNFIVTHRDDVEKDSFIQWANFVTDYLVRIDDKLNRILERIECETSRSQKSFHATVLNISGSGMRLQFTESVQLGQFLHISMNFPVIPATHFEGYGKVTRISPSKREAIGKFDVAVKFFYISEADREKLIACTFSMQRKKIRSINESASD